MSTKHWFILALVTVLGASPALTQAKDTADAAKFQQVMFRVLYEIEEAAGMPHRASKTIKELPKEGRDVLYKSLHDKEGFFQSADSALERIQAVKAKLAADKPAVPDAPKETLTADLTAALYTPNYPPAYSAAYNIVKVLGLTSSNTKACDGVGLEIYEDIHYTAEKVADVTDAICTVAGCDPTGIGCAIVCAFLQAYKEATLLARIPLAACKKHGEGVAAAEIEAAHENTRSIFTNLGTHDGNLATHDAQIKALLTNHQAMLEEVIRLLKTPQGQRDGWNQQ
jgi:hypothetical protein